MNTKKCPFCAEEILEEAKKCKHCGEFIDGNVKNEPKKEKEPTKVIVEQKSSGLMTVLIVLIIIILIVFILGI